MKREKGYYCPTHKDFNPYGRTRENIDCDNCAYLWFGARKAGYFNKENKASGENIADASVKIKAPNLKCFGRARSALAQTDFYFYVDTGEEEVYVSGIKASSEYSLWRELKEMGCTVVLIKWDEPRSSFPRSVSQKDNLTVSVEFGKDRKEISFSLKGCMTPDEFRGVLEEAISASFDLPKENIQEKEF